MAKLSDEVINQIPVLYEQYKTYTKVAEVLGISAGTVSKYVKLAKAADPNMPAQAKTKRIIVTPEIKAQLNEYYLECLNQAETARHFGISTSTVKRHLTDETLKKVEEQYEDRDALYFYIVRLFDGQKVSTRNLVLMERYRKEGINYKAQLLTLKYFYEIEHHTTEKSHGSIGIIPYVVQRAKGYYLTQKEKRAEIEAGIQKQLEQDRVEIKYNPRSYWSNPNKKKKEIDLSQIEGDD